MDTVVLLLRLFLAGMFVFSAVAKVVDPKGTRTSLAGFGVPEALLPVGVWALPAAEVIIAALLLPESTAWWGGLAGLALLAVFTGAIAYNLSKGRTPECHCFGAVSSEPIGTRSLVRNGIFIAIALGVVALGWGDAGPSAIRWIERMSGAEAAMILLLGVIGGLAGAIAWSARDMLAGLRRIEAALGHLSVESIPSNTNEAAAVEENQEPQFPSLPVGSPAPAFTLDGIYGDTGTLESLRSAGNPVLLVFSSPNCGPCNALMPDIGRWQRELNSALTVAVIGRGEAAANRAKSAEHGLRNVLLQRSGEVSDLYLAHATPMAVLIDEEGKIASPLAGGAEAIRALVEKFVAEHPAPVNSSDILQQVMAQSGSQAEQSTAETEVDADDQTVLVLEEEESDMATTITEVAPALTDLDGNTVQLEDMLTDNSALLFWNPGCGYCKRMLDNLKAWEADPQEDAPNLIVISTGTVEANREQAIGSTVLLDSGFATGRKYGAGGTPTALLVDKTGEPRSEHAVGGPNVIALLSGKEPEPEAPAPQIVALEPGQQAPAFELDDLNGEHVSLADYSGRETLVMFWSPGCVHCQRMLDDLRAWESARPAGAPDLVIISGGDVEANKAAGLQSHLLLDNAFATGRAYGASGTPSGYLVAADGTIASPLTVGAGNLFRQLKYVSAACQECLDACDRQGGGEACKMVCQMSGQCY